MHALSKPVVRDHPSPFPDDFFLSCLIVSIKRSFYKVRNKLSILVHPNIPSLIC